MIRFNFTPGQKYELKAQIADTVADVLSVRFETTDATEADIRRRIYLQGRLDVLNELFADNYPDPTPENSDELPQ